MSPRLDPTDAVELEVLERLLGLAQLFGFLIIFGKRTNALFNSGDELEPDFALIMLLRRFLKLFHGREQLDSIGVRGLFAGIRSLVQKPR